MKNLIIQKFLKLSLFKVAVLTFIIFLIPMLIIYDGHIGASITISLIVSFFITSVTYLNKVSDSFYDKALYIEDKIAHLKKDSDPILFEDIFMEIEELNKSTYDPHSRAKIRQLRVLLNYMKK